MRGARRRPRQAGTDDPDPRGRRWRAPGRVARGSGRGRDAEDADDQPECADVRNRDQGPAALRE
jgi:hypothetical protein